MKFAVIYFIFLNTVQSILWGNDSCLVVIKLSDNCIKLALAQGLCFVLDFCIFIFDQFIYLQNPKSRYRGMKRIFFFEGMRKIISLFLKTKTGSLYEFLLILKDWGTKRISFYKCFHCVCCNFFQQVILK